MQRKRDKFREIWFQQGTHKWPSAVKSKVERLAIE